MKNCPFCNESIKVDALRCKHCGHDLPVKKCPWCAEIIDESAVKCQHCKSYLEKIICGGCGKHADISGMRCDVCTHHKIEDEVAHQVATEQLKIKTERIVLLIITAGAVLFALVKML